MALPRTFRERTLFPPPPNHNHNNKRRKAFRDTLSACIPNLTPQTNKQKIQAPPPVENFFRYYFRSVIYNYYFFKYFEALNLSSAWMNFEMHMTRLLLYCAKVTVRLCFFVDGKLR